VNKYESRREFVRKAGKIIIAAPLVLLPAFLARKVSSRSYVWQIDPMKCTQCGQCETNCVKTPSAVKCTHAFVMCGYCDLCGGFLRQGIKTTGTGAEREQCPTGAIHRRFVEEPYFEYTIDRNLCIACGKCVKGCNDFGNGSLYLQIHQDLCDNCNDCSIARTCPSQAISRVSSSHQYIPKEKNIIKP
jgi:Na+-translocating ferredoxin:NAD+ oxidoreductase subunit B